jgi:uncharacterized protein YndB with AHSA1/START domain
MNIKTIKKQIDINASKENVWEALTKDELNKIWYAEYSEGTTAKTDWQVGSKVTFVDSSGSGIIGKIIESKPGGLLSIEYTGVVENGAENYENEGAQQVKNTFEIYKLSENNGVTHLDISSDMGEEYFEMMDAAWDRAMEKIKELAENL